MRIPCKLKTIAKCALFFLAFYVGTYLLVRKAEIHTWRGMYIYADIRYGDVLHSYGQLSDEKGKIPAAGTPMTLTYVGYAQFAKRKTPLSWHHYLWHIYLPLELSECYAYMIRHTPHWQKKMQKKT